MPYVTRNNSFSVRIRIVLVSTTCPLVTAQSCVWDSRPEDHFLLKVPFLYIP